MSDYTYLDTGIIQARLCEFISDEEHSKLEDQVIKLSEYVASALKIEGTAQAIQIYKIIEHQTFALFLKQVVQHNRVMGKNKKTLYNVTPKTDYALIKEARRLAQQYQQEGTIHLV